MKLTLKRIYFAEKYTIGKLYVDGVYFCDTLEDKYRDLSKEKKVMHETAIPFGTYEVIVNLSPKFKRELPRLLNVPNFDGILIHSGLYPSHTSGCILVGENKIKGALINSKPYEVKLIEIIKQGMLKGKVTIEII